VKKLNERQRKWQMSRTRKIMRRIARLKHPRRKRHNANTPNHTNRRKKKARYILEAPIRLSLLSGTEETLTFFEKVLQTIKMCKYKDRLYFNLEKIEYISIDAIMYIIALIKNVKRVNAFQIECVGNLPICDEAKRLIEESGFYNFVTAINRPVMATTNSSKIQITSGREADGALTGTICDFVHAVSGRSRIETKRLFSMIMELMTNTKQHAYRGEAGIMVDKWYVFAENTSDYIQFVFLDTGAGIPTTIKKKLTEKLKDVAMFWETGYNDAKYISSALKGEFRSETGQGYRGKGLPGIYIDSCNGLVSELTIISGQGKCTVNPDCLIEEVRLETNFTGTLLMWKFRK
jgi:hypothetical protein